MKYLYFMKEKIQKSVVQMTATKEEIKVIKLVSVMGNFASISDYIRSLVTADISAKKKAHPNPFVYGGNQYWTDLSAEEREQYLNQIAPVKPNSLDYFLHQKKYGPSPMEVLISKEREQEERAEREREEQERNDLI